MTGPSCATPRLEVVAVIMVARGKVLLARRRGGNLDGLWEFPGGKIRPTETIGQAAIREIEEELGLRIVPDQVVLTLDHDYPDKAIRLHFHQGHILEGQKPRLTEVQAHWEIGWFSPDTIHAENLCPADQRAARDLPWHEILSRETIHDI